MTNFSHLLQSKGAWTRRHSVSFVIASSESSFTIHPVNLKRRNSVGGNLSCATNQELEAFMFTSDASASISDGAVQLCMDQIFSLSQDWTREQPGEVIASVMDPIRVVARELPVPPPSVYQRKCRRSGSAS